MFSFFSKIWSWIIQLLPQTYAWVIGLWNFCANWLIATILLPALVWLLYDIIFVKIIGGLIKYLQNKFTFTVLLSSIMYYFREALSSVIDFGIAFFVMLLEALFTAYFPMEFEEFKEYVIAGYNTYFVPVLQLCNKFIDVNLAFKLLLIYIILLCACCVIRLVLKFIHILAPFLGLLTKVVK